MLSSWNLGTKERTLMIKQFVLTSSARTTTVLFETVKAAEEFLSFCKLSEETICLTDLFDDKIVFTRTYN